MITDLNLKPAVHDRVLVEAELDGQSISFRAVAVNVIPTAIWLGLVLPQPQLEQLKRDQPIQLTFRRDGTGMIAASSFVGHLGVDPLSPLRGFLAGRSAPDPATRPPAP